MPIQALMGWIGGLSAGAKLSMASSVVSGLSSYAAAKAQRKQAIKDQDNQLVRMRNAAQRAGFNPLTVLRATGGQGFTGLPAISKAAAFGNMATGIFDAVRQSPIDKYNKQVRDLEIKQRKADLELMPMRGKLMKAQYNDLMTQTGFGGLLQTPKLQGDPVIPTGFVPSKESTEQHVVGGFGKTIHPSSMSSASTVEEQYGEPVSWAYGISKLAADVINTGHVEWKGYLDRKGYKYTPPVFARNTSKSRGNGNVGYVYKMHKQDQP
jgi:hypothetical protein